MAKPPHGTWVVDDVDQTTLERLAAAHTADPLAVELGVDLVADPNREDDEGYVWTRLHTARDVRLDWLPRVRKITADGKSVIIATVDQMPGAR